MTRPSTRKLFLGALALTVFAGGTIVMKHGEFGDALAQMPGGEAPAMPVPVITVAQKPVQIWKEFSGRLTAVDYVEIRPQVSGLILSVNFEDGQIVKKGDVLFTIDPRPYEAAVAQAKADVAGAVNEAAYAKKEMARAEELLKTGAVSKQGYDERINSLKVNQSTVSAANARLKAAQVDLDNATIKAPVDGRISRPEITEGNLVSAANAPLLTTIVSDKEIYGDFEVDEQTYLTFVRTKAGQDLASEQAVPVRMHLKSDNQKLYQGTIKSFDNRINPGTGTIRARAVFPNPDTTLLPGMFARIEIGSTGEENVMTVPEKAVLTDQSKKFVYVITDGAATYREVKLGDVVGHDRIVLSGLKAGDEVIVENLMKVRPGAKVQGLTPEQMAAMQAQQGGAPAAAPAEEPAAPEAAPAQEERSVAEQPQEAQPEATAEPSAEESAPAENQQSTKDWLKSMDETANAPAQPEQDQSGTQE